MQIYIAKNNTRTGPYSDEQVHGMLKGGLVSSTDLAWREGTADWQPLHSLIGGTLPPALTPQVQKPIDRKNITTDGPTGVGGWLAFFCFGLIVLAPGLGVLQMLGGWAQAESVFDIYPAIKGIIIFEYVGSAALFIYGFFVGVAIWGGNPGGRELAKRFLLIRLCGMIAIEAIALVAMGFMSVPSAMLQQGIGGAIGAVFQSAVYFTVWWLYLKKSKRVRNTYGPE